MSAPDVAAAARLNVQLATGMDFIGLNIILNLVYGDVSVAEVMVMADQEVFANMAQAKSHVHNAMAAVIDTNK